jgi:diguanylate cyclase (GGDEF)-like protein
LDAEAVLTALGVPVHVTDTKGVVTWANTAATELGGGAPVGRPEHEAFGHAGADQGCTLCLARSAGLGLPVVGQAGAEAVEVTASSLADGSTVVATRVAVASAAPLARRTPGALHDAITDLPTRVPFLDAVNLACARLASTGGGLAVLVLDLDGMKDVNDSLGHEAGDRLLADAAARLRAALRPTDTLGRIETGDFAVLAELVPDEPTSRILAERLLDVFTAPFELPGGEVFCGARVGIALARAEVAAEDLLRDATAASSVAKRSGAGRIEVFAESMRATALLRRSLENDLRRALDRGELRVHFQPKVALHNRRVVGLEALVRWEHPERGMVSPADFIPLAEETGLVVPIGEWVLWEACRIVSPWRRRKTGGHLLLAVNVSPVQLGRPTLATTIASALQESGTPPSQLCLEITEASLVGDVDGAAKAMHELKELGVQLAIDDFGAGHASFGYLRQFPANLLKIDKSFVDGVSQTAEGQSLVASVVSLAHSLGMSTIAEGVERSDQAAALRRMGCDMGQGYWFARPGPADVIGPLVVSDAPLGDTAARTPARA